ncbi:protein krueppel [Trichonephila clavipes]|nr:protein krueppel [Trichonephila clavipes]
MAESDNLPNLLILADLAAERVPLENDISVGSRKRKQPIESIRKRQALDNFSRNLNLCDPEFRTNLVKKNVQHNGKIKTNGKLSHDPDIDDVDVYSFTKKEISAVQFLISMKNNNKKPKKQVKELSIVHDHNYTVFPPKGGTKRNKASTGKSDKIDTEKVTLQRVLPQFIIPTPPFPYVHGSSDIQVAAKCEIRHNGEPVNYIREITVDPELYSNSVISSVHAKKQNLSRRKRTSRSSNKVNVTGSVLECVENRVDIKLCQPSTSKGINFTLDNNFENSENLQKTNPIKRKAEELIVSLTLSKKKKSYPKVLSCEICKDKSFTTPNSLLYHYRSHAGIKPFQCPKCNATFTRHHSLKYHLLVHSNENNYTCDYCKREFRHLSHYKEHLRRHTGETPYCCPECKKRFVTRNSYKRHMLDLHNKVLTKHGINDLNSDNASKV